MANRTNLLSQSIGSLMKLNLALEHAFGGDHITLAQQDELFDLLTAATRDVERANAGIRYAVNYLLHGEIAPKTTRIFREVLEPPSPTDDRLIAELASKLVRVYRLVPAGPSEGGMWLIEEVAPKTLPIARQLPEPPPTAGGDWLVGEIPA